VEKVEIKNIQQNMKRKILLYAVLPLMAFAVIGTAYVKADTSSQTSSNPMSGLITAIAEKFGLNVSDVQQVFDEQQTKMQAERETQQAETETNAQEEFASRLSKAVTDGKLTQAQADLITAKKAELDAARESQKTDMKSMTDEERQAAMETMKTQMDSLKQWATDNSIPEEYIPLLGGMGGRGGRGGGPGTPGDFGGPGNGPTPNGSAPNDATSDSSNESAE
jgi:hypothetical protein